VAKGPEGGGAVGAKKQELSPRDHRSRRLDRESVVSTEIRAARHGHQAAVPGASKLPDDDLDEPSLTPEASDETRPKKQPTARQQEILDELLRDPVMARVARTVGVNERTVRRVRDANRPLLEQMRRELAMARFASERSRRMVVEDSLDANLPDALKRLGELATGTDGRLALAAIKSMLDAVLRLSVPESPGLISDELVYEASYEILARLALPPAEPEADTDRG
jgi:hypothetical protein